ncbi:MAG: hypothetical protein ABI556_17245, partial [Gemmatimonadales bacterium]
TSIWIDPDREMFVVLLTNRVHAAKAQRPAKIIADVRSDLSDAAVLAVLDGPTPVLAMPNAFRADQQSGWTRPKPQAVRCTSKSMRGSSARAKRARASCRAAKAKSARLAKASRSKRSSSSKASASKSKRSASSSKSKRSASSSRSKSSSSRTAKKPVKKTSRTAKAR